MIKVNCLHDSKIVAYWATEKEARAYFAELRKIGYAYGYPQGNWQRA